MIKKEMIAILLAGGQGSRLGVLTERVAKPALPFGGKYRIIDFPLSNCINSGVDTVGVLAQYRSLRLNSHIGIGIPWDLDRQNGGVTILPPYERSMGSEWDTGTANAIYQNLEYMESYNPDYVLVLSGDHIYKMDYQLMLDFHKAQKAGITIAVRPASVEEAGGFGIVVTDENKKITDFEGPTQAAENNLAGMGIYIFSWKILKEVLEKLAGQSELDLRRHVIPRCQEMNVPMYAYEFHSYWNDVGTLNSYWQANMELIDVVPEFNFYEEYWKIYTKNEVRSPQYLAKGSVVEKSIIGEGSDIYGRIYNSVIGCGVTVGKDTVVRNSIIMNHVKLGDGCEIDKAVIAENAIVGKSVKMGTLLIERENETAPQIYNHGIVTVGEKSVIPDGVTIGKNSVISGKTEISDYENSTLLSGRTLIRAGE